MGIRDARLGHSPVPMTSFSSMIEANEYAIAYSKALAKTMKKKQESFFGDPEFFLKNKQEWEDDPIASGMRGDPLRPGMKEVIPNRWIGGI